MGKKHIRQKSYCLWKMVLNWVNYLEIMNTPIKIVMVFLLLTTISIDSMSQEPQWKMIWNDEFEKNGLPDSNKWSYDVGGHGWGNNELQFYTDKRNKNARVENGNLIIEALRENYKEKEYTSARLVTRDKASWNHGKIEVRAKIPSGLGTWPAIWMLADKMPLNWPDDGEIDIMEHVGYDQNFVHGTIHTKKYNHIIGTQKANQVTIPVVSDNFHRFQLKWDQETMYIGVDDIYYFKYKNENTGNDAWPFHNKMYLVLNLAVGGNWGGSKGVATDIWPRRMEVDYVRVYEAEK